MELDLATIVSTLGLAGILALIGWAFKMNSRMTKLEADVRHGFEGGRKTMKRHSENLKENNEAIHALQLTAAEIRGRDGGDPSSPGLRPHGGGDG